MDVRAAHFASFDSTDELLSLLQTPIITQQPLLILGSGSNVLFTKDVAGSVLKNNIKGIEKVDEDDQYYFIKAGAGENWHSFVMHCVEHGYAGIENLALIPGSVGASPMQNIGAYGVEIKDVFHSLEAIHIKEGYSRIFTADDCAFGYRESVFKNQYKHTYVITSVTYRLAKKPSFVISYGAIEQQLEKMQVKELSLHSVAQAVMSIRQSKLPDPAVLGNAGSFFKNPTIPTEQYHLLKENFSSLVAYEQPNSQFKLAAGWLIEQCGWKGFRKGDAGCHSQQALVLVNHGNATGEQIYQLSEDIIQSVESKFGVVLEREVNIY
jgi:UDP-N-acetylmuramate dehydrogenase